MTIKFIFLLKNGKTFDCIEQLSEEQVVKCVETLKTTFRDGLNAGLLFEDCCICVQECAVVSWEVLDEQKTEES